MSAGIRRLPGDLAAIAASACLGTVLVVAVAALAAATIAALTLSVPFIVGWKAYEYCRIRFGTVPCHGDTFGRRN